MANEQSRALGKSAALSAEPDREAGPLPIRLKMSGLRMRATREQLSQHFLPQYGEVELAERVMTITDAQLDRIGELAAYYAWSVDALELLGGSMGGARAACLATIDVLEETMRDLHQSQSLQERD